MKYLVIGGVLGFIGLLVYLRLRPYLNLARRVLGVMRDAHRISRQSATTAGAPPRSEVGEPAAARRGNEKLIRCVACGSWSPASRVLTLRSPAATYCSHQCLERSVGEARTRTGGG